MEKLKIETLLLQLLKEGKSFEDFVIAPMGLHGRGLEEEVIELRPIKSKADKSLTGKTKIEIRREGIYDALPQGLFHEIVQDEEAIEAQKNRQVEASARTFFLPYEQEFYRARLRIEEYERSLIDGHATYFQASQYAQLWSIEKDLTEEQTNKLLSILPYVPHIVGNLKLTTFCFEKLLGHPVSLHYQSPTTVDVGTNHSLTLGSTLLSKDSILGNTYYEGTPALELVIQEVNGIELSDYLPTGATGKFIDYITNFLIPLDIDFSVRCEIKTTDSHFVLQREDSRLGYSCRL